MISGKRNDVVDAGIIEVNGTWTIRANYGELNALVASLPGFVAENLLHAAKDQLFGRTAFFRGARLKAAVYGVGDIDGCYHIVILQY